MSFNDSSRKAFAIVFACALSAASFGIAAQKDATAKSPAAAVKPAAPVPDASASKPDQAMSNADVFAMLAAKLSSDIIVAQIGRADRANFDLTTEDLIKLKKQGATDEVLKAMMSKRDSRVAAPTVVPTAVSTPVAQSAPAAATAAPESARGTSAVSNAAADGRPCVVNFVVTGNLLSGRTANSFQEYPTGKKSTAFSYLIQKLASTGGKVTSSDKDTGLISAANDVAFGKAGQSTTTNVLIVEQGSGGIRVELTYRAPFGITFSRPRTQDVMCSVLEGVPG